MLYWFLERLPESLVELEVRQVVARGLVNRHLEILAGEKWEWGESCLSGRDTTKQRGRRGVRVPVSSEGGRAQAE